MSFLFLFLKVEWEPDRARARRPGPQSQPIRNMHDRVSSLEYWVYIWCVICRFQAWTVFLAKAQSRAQTKLGSFHLPSQRRQKCRSGLKISLFFSKTLFLIRQHRLSIANKSSNCSWNRIYFNASIPLPQKTWTEALNVKETLSYLSRRRAGDARLLRIEKWPSLADSGESFFGGAVRPSPGKCTARPDSRRRRQVRKRPAVVHIASHGCPKYLE